MAALTMTIAAGIASSGTRGECGFARVGDVGGEQDELAVREVDDLHRPEDQRQPQRDERVGAAGQDARPQCLQDKVGHRARSGPRRFSLLAFRSFGCHSFAYLILEYHHGTPGKAILPLAFSFGQTTTTCLPWCWPIRCEK